eukprot:768595-Hanusia_phi.AAC.4
MKAVVHLRCNRPAPDSLGLSYADAGASLARTTLGRSRGLFLLLRDHTLARVEPNDVKRLGARGDDEALSIAATLPCCAI